ncbi:MAG: RNA polymerase sigma-54 factor, partial [Polyangiaceae bacterium]
MEIKQQIKLSQQLVMTPQLQQAIRLLQLSRLELIDEIRKELDANPVLADDEIDPRPRDNSDRSSPSPLNSEKPVEERVGETERFERDVNMAERAQEKKVQEVDWEQFLENRTLQAPLPSTRGGFEDLPPIEQNLTRAANLQEHLMWQLQMSDFTLEERRFAELVIGNLDEKGYLDLKGIERDDGSRTPDLTIEDLAREAHLDPEDAPDVLRLMQEFDPLGVCSRTLQECLKVQAEVCGFDELELAIVDRHLHNLEKHNYQAIARDLRIPLEEVYEAAQEIQK